MDSDHVIRPVQQPLDEPTEANLNRIAATMLRDRANLSIDDARTLYLFGPAVFSVRFTDGSIHTAHVRTSLDAALGDARQATGRDDRGVVIDPERSRYWLGACGYLMLLDQLSSVLRFKDFERFLRSDLVGLSADSAGAIYGLRNAFVHSYGLVNDAKGQTDANRKRRRHNFNLNVGGSELVIPGGRTDVLTKSLPDLPPTTVDLGRLGDFVEMTVAEIRRRHLTREGLRWAVSDVTTFVGLSFFHHVDPI